MSHDWIALSDWLCQCSTIPTTHDVAEVVAILVALVEEARTEAEPAVVDV